MQPSGPSNAYGGNYQPPSSRLIIYYGFWPCLNQKCSIYCSFLSFFFWFPNILFLQGRALLNAIGNLELTGAYAEALRNLGHKLEHVAIQVRCFFMEFPFTLKYFAMGCSLSILQKLNSVFFHGVFCCLLFSILNLILTNLFVRVRKSQYMQQN